MLIALRVAPCSLGSRLTLEMMKTHARALRLASIRWSASQRNVKTQQQHTSAGLSLVTNVDRISALLENVRMPTPGTMLVATARHLGKDDGYTGSGFVNPCLRGHARRRRRVKARKIKN